MKTIIHIHVKGEGGLGSFKEVKAEAIVIPGYEDFNLFLTRPFLPGAYWNVTEGLTGCCFASGGSQKDAIDNAAARLNKDGRQVTEGSIRHFLQSLEVGISPSFIKEAQEFLNRKEGEVK